jgi:hypothetical protein
MTAKTESPEERTARILCTQATHCGRLGSSLYEGLLRNAAEDLLADGPTARVLDGHLADPGRSALPLRMLGGVHALVLTGKAAPLATFYPSSAVRPTGVTPGLPGGRCETSWTVKRPRSGPGCRVRRRPTRSAVGQHWPERSATLSPRQIARCGLSKSARARA